MNAPDRLALARVPSLSRYELDDALTATAGPVFLTGTQALVRLLLMQRALDEARGLRSAGFVSGYRGSPLGAYDQQLWRNRARLEAANVQFLPAVNEELAATALVGSQQVESDPQRTVDGVFGLWYGKGPGVDRAGDALKHGNARGASPNGGVLVVAGDDHGCVSSAFSHQSDFAMMSWRMPVLSPASVDELLEFGLYGWALSRSSGAWVGMKAISEVVESAATVNLDALPAGYGSPGDAPPAGASHFRPDDTPNPAIEARMAARLDAVREFARTHSIDRLLADPPQAHVGIVTCGKAHRDLLESLRRIGIGLEDLAGAGVRLYKVGLAFPIEPTRMLELARGLGEVLVVEEKGAVVEQQMQALLYNAPADRRPAIVGKRGLHGESMLSEVAELRPSRLLPVLAEWLARHCPSLDRRERVGEFVRPALPSNAADAVRRMPFFCSGCPHNTSTRVPEGSRAQSGIGCHGMAMWMDRGTSGLLQMGGEGADWVCHARFTRTPHVFQNLGDGTYFHSGYLAIRQAVAAGTQVTYKILNNDAVAMTGGQPADGVVNAASIARQVRAEGVERIAVVSDDPAKYRRDEFPPGTTFHDRKELDGVQRELREVRGVSALVYDQTCAAEKRRRRKRGEYPDPPRRVMINEAVCEGCGDCNAKSNCLSVVPTDTPDGRKRRIDQSTCNKDYRCADGFCPSFVSVRGGRLRRAAAALDSARLESLAAALPEAAARDGGADAPYDLLVTGVGGTGVVTVGAVIAMAAHLEGRHASVLDFMGFAQKGGSVLSHVRLADDAGALNQVRIDTQQADAVLACDPVVAAADDALQSVSRGRTRIVANTHVLPLSMQVSDPDMVVPEAALLEKLAAAAGEERLVLCDAHTLASRALGDTIGANIVLLGFAWQTGIVPVSSAALERAIELNGVAVEANRNAFRIGRLYAHDARALEALLAGGASDEAVAGAQPVDETLTQLVARLEAQLTAYQNARHAARLRRLVDRVAAAESALRAPGEALALAATVAVRYAKLLAYKDEYEVARLHASPEFRRELEAQFEGDYRLSVHLAPPLLARRGADGLPRKMEFGAWVFPVFRGLAALRGLRGTPLDVFGYTMERRMERALAADYERTIDALLPRLARETLDTAVQLADLPDAIRGYGHVKLRHLAQAKRREAELLRALGLQVPTSAIVQRAIERSPASSLAGIPVVVRRT